MTTLRRGLRDANEILRIGIDFFLLFLDPESETIKTTDKTRFHPLGVAFVTGVAVLLSSLILVVTYNWIPRFGKWGIASAVFAFAPLFICATRFAYRWAISLLLSLLFSLLIGFMVSIFLYKLGVGTYLVFSGSVLVFIFCSSVSFSMLIRIWNKDKDENCRETACSPRAL